MTDDLERYIELELNARKMARENLLIFTQYTMPKYQVNWHHEVISDVLEKFYRKEIKKLMLFQPPQTGKLLEVNESILTSQGFKKHGDLRVGDYVFGKDGKPVKVLATQEPYLEECFDVHFDNGEVITAGQVHEWEILTDRGRRKVVDGKRIKLAREVELLETKDIFTGYHHRNPAIELNCSIKTPQQVLPIDPYWLGLWLGDGTSNGASICIGKQDYGHYLKIFGKDNVRFSQPKNRTDIWYMQTYNRAKELRLLGLKNNKHIPELYLMASEAQRRELLAGLLDSDGYVDSRGRIELTTVKESLSKDYLRLIRSLGYKVAIVEGDASIDGRYISKKYRICFTPKVGEKLCKLKRRQDAIDVKPTKDRSDKERFFITKIVPVGKKLGSCIQVEGGYYLAGESLILTHNSELCTRRFSSYKMGRDPDTKLAIASYSQEFASTFNRDIKKIMESVEYKNVFPEISLGLKGSATVNNATDFGLENFSGNVKTVGVLGGITGNPVDLGIIDDPIKGAEQAHSKKYRESMWEWYLRDFLTRLHNDSQQLITLTRWHEDDLAGRILELEGDDWEIVKLPAINTAGRSKYDRRDVGEALWEEKQSLARMLEAQSRNASTFMSMYQQEPTNEEGEILQKADFKVRQRTEVPIEAVNATRHAIADTAYTTKAENDPSAVIIYSEFENELYIWDYMEVREELSNLIRTMVRFVMPHFSRRSVFYVEPKASGQSVVDLLKKQTMLTIKEHKNPAVDKVARVWAAEPSVAGGRVNLIEGKWVTKFINDCASFPKIKHDEAPDLLAMAISRTLNNLTTKRRKRRAVAR